MNINDFVFSRQQALRYAGVGLATTAAGCATYGKAPEPASTGPADEPAAGTAAPASKVLAKTTDVPVGSGAIIDEVVVTQPSQGVFKAFSAVCTHAGCRVATVADGVINCPCHGSKFNIDGSVANGPAQKPLTSTAITVQDDSIMLA
ncbi:(2Fe-2S)-binding protein [Mycolicibacterium setense]|uniref:Cytochrome bc1 complex Rieske iron-sulfur subunit n=1 Tax=Mycolicibacterium setense TaxID=431269 RepID=A0ABR4YU07_9MYCO|nr:Rieske (2Fe-2S) protein [Mycolicibacterium setense]KHO24427.1 (2Fe-2S)-binding protein [Mycolicibacterium setense]